MESLIVSSAEMRAAEKAAFARGSSAETLMDEAAAGIARAIMKFFPAPGRCVVFAGKGNNAGDAFATAAILRERGWKIETRLAYPENDLGELARKKFNSLSAGRAQALTREGNTVILDGLLGLGAKPPLREPIKSCCRELNRRKRKEGAYVFAVDLPTGLDGDTGKADCDCVVADFTLTVGYAKRGLIADGAINQVGRIEVVSLGAFAVTTRNEVLATPDSLRALLLRRKFDAYKNQFGRVGIIAGSKGLTGAAILCSLGALRAGAGLVELFVPEEIYPIVASAAAPEVMVKPIRDYAELLEQKVDVWALGPGLGQEHAEDISRLIAKARQPMVVDADGLNVLARNVALLRRAAGPRLLTPHPGEMKRIFPAKEKSRAQLARKFCAKYPATLLLKGARTIVAERKCAPSYNTTGNPGMATGGMGDALTGVCAALIAQKLSLYDAARLGAWLCGRAAETAIFEHGASEQSLLPTDLLAHLGEAFSDLQKEF